MSDDLANIRLRALAKMTSGGLSYAKGQEFDAHIHYVLGGCLHVTLEDGQTVPISEDRVDLVKTYDGDGVPFNHEAKADQYEADLHATLVDALTILQSHEWDDDMDETACPTGGVSCGHCDGGGSLHPGSGRKIREPQHREDCKMAKTIASLKKAVGQWPFKKHSQQTPSG